MGPLTSLNSEEENNLFLLLEIETQYLGHSACGPSILSTELSWFSSNPFHRCIYIGKYLFIYIYIYIYVCVCVCVCVCGCQYIQDYEFLSQAQPTCSVVK